MKDGQLIELNKKLDKIDKVDFWNTSSPGAITKVIQIASLTTETLDKRKLSYAVRVAMQKKDDNQALVGLKYLVERRIATKPQKALYIAMDQKLI